MKRWEAWINHAGWTLAAASGVLYGIFKYFVASPDPDSRVGHPWQPVLLAIHVIAAPVAVFGLGLLFRRHALSHLATGTRERRRTGTVMTLLAIPLAMSGYVVQVLTGESARRWTGWAHAALGLLWIVGYALHPLASRVPENDSAANVQTADPRGPAEAPLRTRRRV
jgi:hypothetical protein